MDFLSALKIGNQHHAITLSSSGNTGGKKALFFVFSFCWQERVLTFGRLAGKKFVAVLSSLCFLSSSSFYV